MNLSFSHESVSCASQSFHEFGESSKDLCIIILDSICRWLAASQRTGFGDNFRSVEEHCRCVISETHLSL
jgi:hypothetical protein